MSPGVQKTMGRGTMIQAVRGERFWQNVGFRAAERGPHGPWDELPRPRRRARGGRSTRHAAGLRPIATNSPPSRASFQHQDSCCRTFSNAQSSSAASKSAEPSSGGSAVTVLG